MPGAFRNDPSFDEASAERQIADDVQHLVACRLVVEVQFKVVQDAFPHFDVPIAEQFRQFVRLCLFHLAVHDDNGIAQIPSLDQSVCQQPFHLAQEDKSAAGSHLGGIVRGSLCKCGVLHLEIGGVVGDYGIYGVFVVREHSQARLPVLAAKFHPFLHSSSPTRAIASAYRRALPSRIGNSSPSSSMRQLSTPQP